MWVAAATALLPLLLLCGRLLVSGLPELAVEHDMALLEIASIRAEHGAQLLGPYSRFHFHHPGPLLFYWFAPFHALLGGTFSTLLVAAAVLNLLMVGAIVALAGWAGGRGAALAASFSTLLFTLYLRPDLLTSPWNPHLPILAFAAAVVALAAAVAGRPPALVVAAAAGSLAAQSHVAFVGPLGVAALTAVLLVSSRRLRRTLALPPLSRRAVASWLGAATLLTALLWAPVLYQQLAGPDGNITAIASYLVRHHRGAGLATALAVAARQMGEPLLAPLGVSARSQPAGVWPWAAGAAALLLVASSVAVLVSRRRRDRGFAVALAVLTLVLTPAVVISVAAVTGPIHAFLVRWISAAGFVAILAATVTGAAGLSRSLARAALAGCLLLSLAGAVLVLIEPALGEVAREPRYRAMAALGTRVEQALASTRARTVEVAARGEWSVAPAAGLVLELAKRGWTVSLTPELGFMFGRAMVTHQPPDADLLVVTPPSAADLLDGPGLRRIPASPEAAVLLLNWRPAGPAGPVELKLGTAAAAPYLVSGFYDPEGHGADAFRWSRGTSSTVRLPLHAGTSYRLEMEVMPVRLGNATQEVTVRLDGRTIGTVQLARSRSRHAFELLGDAVEGGDTVTFQYAHTAVPRRRGRNRDGRTLAVRVYSLTATPLP